MKLRAILCIVLTLWSGFAQAAADITVIVDTAVTVPVNILPLTDDGDFKTRETSVAYNAGGLDLVWNFVTPAGVQTQTAVTPTDTAGVYDWTNVGDGMYKIEIPASGGGTINNDTEGYGWFSGLATGVLPWRGPVIEFVPANTVNSLVVGSDKLEVDVAQNAGTNITASGGRQEVNVTHVESGDATDAIAASGTAALNAYDPPTRAELTSDKNEILATTKKYNNYRHVGSGQTHATIEAACAAASAGDVVVVHAGTYDPATQLMFDDIDIYLGAGAVIKPTNLQPSLFSSDGEEIGSGTATRFRIWGPGKIDGTDVQQRIFSVAGEDVRVLCDVGEIVAAIDGIAETNGSGTSGIIVVKAKRISCSGSQCGYNGADVRMHIEAETIVTDRFLLGLGTDDDSVIVVKCPYILCTQTYAGQPTHVIGGGNGTAIIDGTIRFSHASTNGLAGQAPGLNIVLNSGSVVVPAGRPSLSGTSRFTVTDAFAYDRSTYTASNIVRASADHSFVVNGATVSTVNSQTSLALSAGPPDNDALNGSMAIITDASNPAQKAFVVIDDYVASTKTITLRTAPAFTVAVGDRVDIIAGASLGPEAITEATFAASAKEAIRDTTWGNSEGDRTVTSAEGITEAGDAIPFDDDGRVESALSSTFVTGLIEDFIEGVLEASPTTEELSDDLVAALDADSEKLKLLLALVRQTTTIAAVENQTTFTLTAGSPTDDAYTAAVIYDDDNPLQSAPVSVASYDGGQLEVTLLAAPPFEIDAGDLIFMVEAPPVDLTPVTDELETLDQDIEAIKKATRTK